MPELDYWPPQLLQKLLTSRLQVHYLVANGHLAPKWPGMAQNHQNGSKWHCMTPNGPNDFKTLPMGILHDYMSWWTTLGPFQRPTWPQGSPT